MEPTFSSEAMRPGHPKWDSAVARRDQLYVRQGDLRSDFARDYNRILHSTAYRRLKHKTQVFFATQNDHICTRIEHVTHVGAVARTISEALGLNTELTDAIAVGHDLGHAPFGHAGEKVLERLYREELGQSFWHEGNSLRFVDHIETLESPGGAHYGLNLTYAVRDGIICHCGERDEPALFPREAASDLARMTRAAQDAPYTWEGCVVRLADKIAYLGRDIEDALRLGILEFDALMQLQHLTKTLGKTSLARVNNSLLMQMFINDLCKNSSPGKGLVLSENNLDILISLRRFSIERIYRHERLENFIRYAELMITTIFDQLRGQYQAGKTLANVEALRSQYPLLSQTFHEWLIKYGFPSLRRTINLKYQADRLYNPDEEGDYCRAILDYISGMTDSFAMRIFNEIVTF